MARKVTHFRSSDLTFWGFLAVAIWGFAMLAGSAASFMPESWFAPLHATRLEGASLSQMREDVAQLRAEAARLRQENSVLLQRVMLTESAAGEAARRVGALEQTVPGIIAAVEQLATPSLDTATTASTGVASAPSSDGSAAVSSAQSMPQPLGSAATAGGAFAVALGPPFAPDDGEAVWETMNQRLGPLLLGLTPLLGNVEGGAEKRLLVGPIASEAEARQFCGRVGKVGIACASVRFNGTPLSSGETQ